MRKKYRIKEEIDSGGNSVFFIQYTRFHLLWTYYYEDLYTYEVLSFKTLESAREKVREIKKNLVIKSRYHT